MNIQLQVVLYSIFYGRGRDQEELSGGRRKAPARYSHYGAGASLSLP
jgi:hypothetical protein